MWSFDDEEIKMCGPNAAQSLPRNKDPVISKWLPDKQHKADS